MNELPPDPAAGQPAEPAATDESVPALAPAAPATESTTPAGDGAAPAPEAAADVPDEAADAPAADAPATDADADADAVAPVPTEPVVEGAASEWIEEGAGRSTTVHRQNTLAVVLTVVVAVVLAFGGGFAVGRGTAPSGGTATGPEGSGAIAEASGSADPSASTVPQMPSDGPYLGKPDAKVVIDYWADYQCPYCAKFALEVLPLLESRIEDGTVAVQHRDFAFIGAESVAAAVAVRCAGDEGKYWPMHDLVYGAQKGENKGTFSTALLTSLAAQLLPDTTAFTTCLDSHDKLVDVLDDTAAGSRAGIQSTPTIDVNGQRFLGVPDTAKFLAVIDAAAAGASPQPLPTVAPSSEPWSGIQTNGREAGDASAPITVELWMDYQSTDSAAIANDLEPELRKRMADGSLRVVLRDLALGGTESVAAGAFVRCVADSGGPAFFVHDILAVSGQGPDAGIFVPDNFLRLTSKLGLDVKKIDTCLAGSKTSSLVKAETDAGRKQGMTVAPVVVILTGSQEVARFSGAVDTAQVLAAIDKLK